MDPSHRGTYRSANDRDDGEVRIVVDIFNQTPPNYNNIAYHTDVVRAPATRRPEIDLNNPAKQEEDSPIHAPVVNEPVQQAPVEDYTGSFWNSQDEIEFDLNAAVQEAQDRDEAYCQERLENLCMGKAMEDQDEFLDTSFRSSTPAEDPDYYKLWND